VAFCLAVAAADADSRVCAKATNPWVLDYNCSNWLSRCPIPATCPFRRERAQSTYRAVAVSNTNSPQRATKFGIVTSRGFLHKQKKLLPRTAKCGRS
jgi:hypothetical protein